jgi:AcrR family transcriptional regulator
VSEAAEHTPVDLLEAALDLVAREGWHGYGPLKLARETGAGLAEIVTQLGDRAEIFAAMGRRADMAMIDVAAEDMSEMSAKERVFELFMRRFESLRPARPALRRLRREAAPEVWLAGLGNLKRAMKLVVDAAGLDAHGPRRAVLCAALAAAYVRTGRVWLEDDSEDLAATLAALDKQLDRIGDLLRSQTDAAPRATG